MSDRPSGVVLSGVYQKGNGMLLPGSTRNVYLKAKQNLASDIDYIRPKAAWQALSTDFQHDPREDSEMLRGLLSMRQLSLLRTQLKTELAIFGKPFSGSQPSFRPSGTS